MQFNQPEDYEAKQTSSLTRGARWQCQEAGLPRRNNENGGRH